MVVTSALDPSAAADHGDERVDDRPIDGRAPSGAPGITVYWRPGCGYSAALRRRLARAGVATVEHDIWDEPEAAAFVRAHARGHETVPTVDVAGKVLVNPSFRLVLSTARVLGLDAPEPPPRWWQRFTRTQPPIPDG